MEEHTPAALDSPPVRMVLGVQLIFSMLLAVLAQMVFTLIALLAGWDADAAGGSIGADAAPAERWQLRLMLGMNHLFMFIAAGCATVWVFYRSAHRGLPHWADYLQIRRPPRALMVGLAVLLMLCSAPLVLCLLQLSKALPLPEAFRQMEDSTAEMLKGLLQMDGPAELLANLTIIALLPALGEELVFRGILQQQLMRRMSSPWAAMALSAAVFSAVHLQFEGFLSRWLLGMVLGWLFWRSRNLWVPVAAHFVNNALQVLAQHAYHQKVSTVDLEQDVQVPWQVALFSAFLMWAVARVVEGVRK
jgi:uncharacterized protein